MLVCIRVVVTSRVTVWSPELMSDGGVRVGDGQQQVVRPLQGRLHSQKLNRDFHLTCWWLGSAVTVCGQG